jgi:N-acetylneuraminic acid mutarotase
VNRYLLHCLFYFFFAFSSVQAVGDWSLLDCTGKPTGRHETAFVEVDGMFYLIGGREAQGRIDRLDPANLSWSSMKARSPLIHHFQPVVLDGKIWMVGAMTGKFPAEPPMERIHIYDPKADQWTEGSLMPEGRRRGSAGTVIYDGKIYMACGIKLGHISGTNAMFDVYDPQTDTWSQLPDAPHVRDHFHAVVLDDKLYCIGGRNTSMHEKGNPQSFSKAIVYEIDVYDFKTGKWTTLATRNPLGSAAGGTAVLNGKIVYFGGEDAEVARNETWILDPKTGDWTRAGNLKQGRHGSQAIVYNNCIYIAAGSPKRGGGRIDSVERFTLDLPSPAYPLLKNPMSIDYLQANLSKEHPRLVLTPVIEARLKEKLKTDPVVQNAYEAVRLNARKIQSEDLLERKKIGRRLLSVSREMLYRMNMLGMVYRMEKDKKILNRINEELIAVCNFSDWNPSHFLDVGEMSLAVAIALDWTHGDLPQSTVRLAQQALIEKGLKPGIPAKGKGRSYAQNNWNQVCNGGLAAAAIAVAEIEPELAAKTLWRALDGLPVALRYYGPDGSHHEGSTYWNYATVFTAAISDMFSSAFGTDFGIYSYPGIAESAMYRVIMTAPSGWYYNYGDCGFKRGENGDFTLAWFGAKTGNATFIEKDRFLQDPKQMGKLDRFGGLGLVWLSQFEEKQKSTVPTAWAARGVNPVAVFTGGNNDPHGYYLGSKGGCGSVNHGNMDGGSFIFELNGVRWVHDLGKQDYNTIEQTGFNLWGKTQDAQRWQLLSKNNFGHSTITVNGDHHMVDGKTELIEFKDGLNPHATFDLKPSLGDTIKSATRTFLKDTPASLTITDKIQSNRATETITWQLLTIAKVNTDKGIITLKQDGKSLKLECLSHPKINLRVIPLNPPPMKLDSDIPGLKRIEIQVPVMSKPVEFVVRFSEDI